MFTYHSDHVQSALTKKAVLSSIAKIYDPLGALAPITFWAKCFMQRLWKEGYVWDSPISSELASAWALFAFELPVFQVYRLHVIFNQVATHNWLGSPMLHWKVTPRSYTSDLYMSTRHPPFTAKSKAAPLKSGRADEFLSDFYLSHGWSCVAHCCWHKCYSAYSGPWHLLWQCRKFTRWLIQPLFHPGWRTCKYNIKYSSPIDSTKSRN